MDYYNENGNVDPSITTVLLQAATIFANTAVGEAAKRSVGTALDGFRNVVARKFGDSHRAPALLDQVKTAPDSPEAQKAATALGDMNLTIDPDVRAELQKLAHVLEQVGGVTINAPRANKVYGPQIATGPVSYDFRKGK